MINLGPITGNVILGSIAFGGSRPAIEVVRTPPARLAGCVLVKAHDECQVTNERYPSRRTQALIKQPGKA